MEAILWEDPSCLNSANPQNGFTPLHAAARRAHSGLIKLLIKSGADLEAKWRGGETAFIMACKVSCSLPLSSLARFQVPSQQKEGDPGTRLMPFVGVPIVYSGLGCIWHLSRKPDPLLQEREGSGELRIQAKGGTGGARVTAPGREGTRRDGE